jgi:hypothetical protein
MSSFLFNFEHAQLEAKIPSGVVVTTSYVSDPIRGQRSVPEVEVWWFERYLGQGSFGEVRLEVCAEENNKLRVVKQTWAGSAFKVQYERETRALLEFSKLKYKESAVFVESFGWFQDLNSVYLAMVYISLGQLKENIIEIGGPIYLWDRG